MADFGPSRRPDPRQRICVQTNVELDPFDIALDDRLLAFVRVVDAKRRAAAAPAAAVAGGPAPPK